MLVGTVSFLVLVGTVGFLLLSVTMFVFLEEFFEVGFGSVGLGDFCFRTLVVEGLEAGSFAGPAVVRKGTVTVTVLILGDGATKPT